MVYPIAITPGEPAGIGPDLCIQLAQHIVYDNVMPVIIADPFLLEERAAELASRVRIIEFDPATHTTAETGTLYVKPVILDAPVRTGKPDPANARYVLNTLDEAVAGCRSGLFRAMVTGPVQKSTISDAGIVFTGHTEYLAGLCGCEKVVMMLATSGLRVALATTHLPLSAVPAAITRDLLERVITILHQDLIGKFGILEPRILVSGLNPHAGEQGHLGREEIDTIIPVIEKFQAAGMVLRGPLPADTLFTEKYLQSADAVLAMYHDQGLPVLKYKGFGKAVNITLGLPIIRTSVDHGTALDLAGSGRADPGSMFTALDYAAAMASVWRPA